jgi:DNA uptake protein ComE-like DNA-binding protein
MRSTRAWLIALSVIGSALVAPGLRAQVGKSLGVVDVNIAPEKDLLAMPGMTPAIVKGILDKRPFMSITELNAYLLSQGLTQAQAMELYPKAFVHVNLNTATREEILLIPGAGNRMTREFPEYRPWRTWAQFDREIGKYVGQEATDRLKQYVFIPINVNTASDEDLQTIPGLTPATLSAIKQGRPWTKEKFEQQIGKAANAKEAARLWRFMVVQ